MTFQALVFQQAAVLMRYPEDLRAPAGAVAALRPLYADGSPEADGLDAMARALEGADLLDVQRDYTALFIGAWKMLAPPYASYHLDGARQLGGPSTVAVEDAYRARGLVLSQERRKPGDHLSVMLEFLFVLLRDGAGGADGADAQAAAFFHRFVAPWVPAWGRSVADQAKTGFYAAWGALAPLILIDDSLLDEPRL